MTKIILATTNKGKIAEINRVFSGTAIEFIGLDAFPGMPAVVEDGNTFNENAYKKAKAVFEHTGIVSVSEDSGLEVDALNGVPGIYSSRFASETASDRENIEKLVAVLKDVPDDKRTARFVSVFCLYDGREAQYFEGTVKGRLTEEPRGKSGFGYDPLFIPDGYERTFAELGIGIKNRISHRANAVKKLKGFLQTQTLNE